MLVPVLVTLLMIGMQSCYCARTEQRRQEAEVGSQKSEVRMQLGGAGWLLSAVRRRTCAELDRGITLMWTPKESSVLIALEESPGFLAVLQNTAIDQVDHVEECRGRRSGFRSRNTEVGGQTGNHLGGASIAMRKSECRSEDERGQRCTPPGVYLGHLGRLGKILGDFQDF